MTTLGKVLVFVNLVFSLVVGAMILMMFITQTNWKDGYDRKASELISERGRHQKTLDAKNEMETAKNNELRELGDTLTQTKKTLGETSDKLAEADTARRNADKAAADSKVTAEAATLAAERMKAEIETLETRRNELTARVLDLETKIADARALATKNSIENQAAQERNKQLLATLEQRDRDLARIRGEQATQAGSAAKNPPPEDLRGRITQTDGELITINLGSDSGLNRGNTMEVFRLTPKPTYVGTLKIMDVRPNEAVGKLVGGVSRGRAQSGDEVASDILGKR
jgi:hypothetical protein